MPVENKDAAYLWDMLDSARTIVQFTSGIKIEGYLRDRKLQLAVERCLEIIGEAAKRVSPEYQADHSDVPWGKIIAQRNVIAHEYGEIKQDRIWAVVSQNIPGLIERLAPLVKAFHD